MLKAQAAGMRLKARRHVATHKCEHMCAYAFERADRGGRRATESRTVKTLFKDKIFYDQKKSDCKT